MATPVIENLNAPYHHQDGTPCWNNQCRKGNETNNFENADAKMVEVKPFGETIASWFGKKKPEPKVYQWSPEDAIYNSISIELQSPDAAVSYILSSMDEDGNVNIPMVGTYIHLLAAEKFIQEGGKLQAVELMGFQDTTDYTPALRQEISNLIVSRMNNGYPGAEMHWKSNYEAAQGACGRFLVAVRGFTVETVEGKTITVKYQGFPSSGSDKY